MGGERAREREREKERAVMREGGREGVIYRSSLLCTGESKRKREKHGVKGRKETN